MTLEDIRSLISVMQDVEPGLGRTAEAHATWASTCGQMAAELRKRNMVEDHDFSETVFLDCCLGKGDYCLSDPHEDGQSWEGVTGPWDSKPMVGREA